MHCSYLPIACFIKYFLLKLSQDKWRDMGLNKYMVNTSHPFFFFVSFRTENYKCISVFLFQIEKGKNKNGMHCITAEVDANLNQYMVNTVVDQFRRGKSY